MRNFKIVFLFVCKFLGLFRLAWWLTRDKLKILCYHGFEINDETQFRPKLFIDAKRFEKRLETIRRYGAQVLSLRDAVDMLYDGKLPKNGLVITIDDGFYSVAKVAAPSLKKHGMLSTVYVTSYYVDKHGPVFRLVVQYMFWKTKKQEISLNGVRWSQRHSVNLLDRSLRDDVMWECINHGEQSCTELERVALCEELGKLLEVSYQKILASRALHLMTPDELAGLAATGMDVELHTHRHHFPGQDRAAAEREIAENRAALSRWLPGRFDHFCYPSGLWNQKQAEWLDGMGVKSSTTCLPGLNSRNTPRHALRRFLDGANIHQLEFEAALSGFSDMLRGVMKK